MQSIDRRVFFRKNLNPLYLPIYDGVCKLLDYDWQPYMGMRTVDAQNKLYAQGRTAPGKRVTEARGGESSHNYGCGSDWTLWNESDCPIWLKSDDSRWKEFAQAVEKAGGDWGGFFPVPDPGHIQLGLTVPWKDMKPILDEKGMDAAYTFIQSHKKG